MSARDFSKHISLLAFGLALSLVSAAQPAGAAAEFYKGKTIRIVVASQPAGRFSLEATLVARQLPKYSGASAITAYVPGGGTLIGANKFFNARPDGLTIGVNRGSKWIFAALAKRPGVDYRWREFTCLPN